MASFVRKVPTASGARAVQIVHKRRRQVIGIEHIRSAHDDVQLALLMEVARQRLHPGQESLDLGPTTAARRHRRHRRAADHCRYHAQPRRHRHSQQTPAATG